MDCTYATSPLLGMPLLPMIYREVEGDEMRKETYIVETHCCSTRGELNRAWLRAAIEDYFLVANVAKLLHFSTFIASTDICPSR